MPDLSPAAQAVLAQRPMTTQQHPIIPPPELVEQWANMIASGSGQAVFAVAAQWGADQELEACCEWFVRDWTDIETADKLRAARRPKPPSLKEQALRDLDALAKDLERNGMVFGTAMIRRALEQLDD